VASFKAPRLQYAKTFRGSHKLYSSRWKGVSVTAPIAREGAPRSIDPAPINTSRFITKVNQYVAIYHKRESKRLDPSRERRFATFAPDRGCRSRHPFTTATAQSQESSTSRAYWGRGALIDATGAKTPSRAIRVRRRRRERSGCEDAVVEDLRCEDTSRAELSQRLPVGSSRSLQKIEPIIPLGVAAELGAQIEPMILGAER
jgi:hypothetical protein